MPDRPFATNRPSRNVRTRRATVASIDPNDNTRYFVNFDGFEGAEPARYFGGSILDLGTSVTVEVAPELKAWRIVSGGSVSGPVTQFGFYAPNVAGVIEDRGHAGDDGGGVSFNQTLPHRVQSSSAGVLKGAGFWIPDVDIPPDAQILSAVFVYDYVPGGSIATNMLRCFVNILGNQEDFDDDPTMFPGGVGWNKGNWHYEDGQQCRIDVTHLLQDVIASGTAWQAGMAIRVHLTGWDWPVAGTEYIDVTSDVGAVPGIIGYYKV